MQCPNCKHENERNQKFCGECGHNLQSAASPGERRNATIMFSDLAGFTAMAEGLDPEQVQGLMRRLKDRSVQIVEHHGGIVSQFVGDEILALFGIPLAHEDDPLRALRAAREIHDLARTLSPEVEELTGRSISMHTGINTGLVVTSTSDSRDGTIGVTGDTVNTAARLKALATDDVVLVGENTARLVEAFVQLEPMGTTTAKGKSMPVKPYRVVGKVAADRTRIEATAAHRGFTAFSGRETELKVLRTALDQTLGGLGQLVTVMGEAGIGKSRLIHEFRNAVNPDIATLVEGRCQSYGAETPYLPLLDALRRSLQIHDISDRTLLHEIAVANIRAISPDLERYLPHLLHLLSIPSSDHKLPETLYGEPLRREMELALAAAATLSAQLKPMIVVFEDWHWADEASDSALKNLINIAPQFPLMLIVLFRPEYQQNWTEVNHHTPVVLDRLDTTNTADMVASVVGVRHLPDGLAETIHTRAEGNALFTEEIARSLQDDGLVGLSGESAVLTRPLSEIRLPDSVQAIIRARADRLEPDEREVLHLASVIGREFDRALLERIAQSRTVVASVLERLARQELVHQTGAVPQTEYIFKHVLTREVVYETILLSQRAELHAAVGQAIEETNVDGNEEHYEVLAHHYSLSNENEKAINFLDISGDKAIRLHSLESAREYFRRAINRMQDTLVSSESKIRMISTTLKWAKISGTQPSEQLLADLEQAKQLAEALQDSTLIARTLSFSSYMNYLMTNFEVAVNDSKRALALSEVIQDEEPIGLSTSIIGRMAFWTCELSPAIDYFRKASPILQRARSWEESTNTSFLGFAYGLTGNFNDGLTSLEAALEIAQQYDYSAMIYVASYWKSVLENLKGTWIKSVSTAHDGAINAEQAGDYWMAAWCKISEGSSRFMSGDAKIGIREMKSAIDALEESEVKLSYFSKYSYLSEVLCISGNVDEAIRVAGIGISGKEYGDVFFAVIARRAMACAIAMKPDPDWSEAEDHFREGREFAERTRQLPNLAISLFRFAECLHKKGDLDAALEQLDQSEVLFQDMGMNWWTEQAEGLRGRINSGQEFVWFAPYVDGPPSV